VHVAGFFSDISTELMFAFAKVHGLSKGDIARAYLETRSRTGEHKSELEAAIAPMAAIP
jgi:hypothetical protein